MNSAKIIMNYFDSINFKPFLASYWEDSSKFIYLPWINPFFQFDPSSRES